MKAVPAMTIHPGEKIRVLVVDDSVVVRRMISRIVEQDPDLELAGSARDGHDALAKIRQLSPHVVTLDVEMPGLDGIGALSEISSRYPGIRVIMLSCLTSHGARITVDALMRGASDYVTKPRGDLSGHTFDSVASDLTAKIRQLFLCKEAAFPKIAAAEKWNEVPKRLDRPEILAIGVSTGGPSALMDLLPMIPADFPLPIAIVQHMPADFTRMLAQRLSRACQIDVVEGEEGMLLRPGCAVVAPGNYHMHVVRAGVDLMIKLDQREKENSCRPAVDVLFRSIAISCKGLASAAGLTGMGQDGLAGSEALKSLGASIIAQDRSTSVVWGMPGAIVGADLADAVLPLREIVPEILLRSGSL